MEKFLSCSFTIFITHNAVLKKAQQYTLFLFLLLQIKTLKEIFVTLNLQNFLLKIIPVYSIINLLWELASIDEMSCLNGQCYVTFMDNIMYITLVCSLKYWTTMTLVYIQVKLSFSLGRVLYMTAFGTLNLWKKSIDLVSFTKCLVDLERPHPWTFTIIHS